MYNRLKILIALLLMLAAGEVARAQEFSVESSTSGTTTTFKIKRSGSYLPATAVKMNAPAAHTTLTPGCYHDLFMDCTLLNRVVCLATDIAASECTGGWMSDVSATGTFVKQDGVEWPAGSAGIPEGWAVDTYVAATE